MTNLDVVAIFNTSPDTVDMLREAFRPAGIATVSAFTFEIRDGHVDLESFMRQHQPGAIVYDIAPPYDQNWQLFQHLRSTPALANCPFVVTSTNVKSVRDAGGKDLQVYEIVGKPYRSRGDHAGRQGSTSFPANALSSVGPHPFGSSPTPFQPVSTSHVPLRAQFASGGMPMLIRGSVLVLSVLWGLWPAPARAQEHQHAAHGGEDVGRVTFPTSCDPVVQPDLERAVAMLHSFWYEMAEASFAQVAKRDPECAMAYWGVAMSIYKPLWQPPSPAEMQRGSAAVARAAAAKHGDAREQAYVRAVATIYTDAGATPFPTRVAAYEQAMSALHAAYPKDDEAAAFYALSLLGSASVSPPDRSYARQKKAAGLLDAVAAAHPQHPGIAHYFIHAYDAPELAHLALPAARAYAKIAPAVPHALHMPSHIFTRLGLWDDAIASNIASAEAARSYAKTSGMAGAWDQELHALDYMMYGYLQGAQDRRAAQVLERLTAMSRVEPPVLAAAYALAAAPARYALERRDWRTAASLALPATNIVWDRYRWSESIVYFAAALGAAHTNDLPRAKQQVATLEVRYQELRGKDKYADLIEAQRSAAAAWIAQAEGRTDEAVALLRSAADLEESIEKHPVTPGAVLPARELLGDLLLAQQKPADALKAYEATLAHSPGRFNSVAGAMRAAHRSGDVAAAQRYARQLVALCAKADTERPEVAEAKQIIGQP